MASLAEKRMDEAEDAPVNSEARPEELRLLEALLFASAEPLDTATLAKCEHIVGMMGHEPIEEALRAGANIVLAGRATETGQPSAPRVTCGTLAAAT